MNGMDEWQREENERLAGPADPDSIAAMRNEIERLRPFEEISIKLEQYTYTLIDRLNGAADEITQLRLDLDHAKAVKEVWMNRARKAEAPALPVAGRPQP